MLPFPGAWLTLALVLLGCGGAGYKISLAALRGMHCAPLIRLE